MADMTEILLVVVMACLMVALLVFLMVEQKDRKSVALSVGKMET